MGLKVRVWVRGPGGEMVETTPEKKVRVRVRGGALVDKASEIVPLWEYRQAAQKWRQWVSHEGVSRRKGERLVEAGKAEPITRMHNGFVQIVGYRRTKPVRASRPSACTLTKSTLEHVAEAVKSEDGHQQHYQVVKFHVWRDVPETFRDREGNLVVDRDGNLMGGYRSPTIRPRVTQAEHKRALALLRIPVEMPNQAEVVALPVVVASVKPLEQRTAAQALAAAGPMLGLKAKPAAGVRVA